MNEEREKVYQILELGKHIKNLHHKKGFGGLLFIDLSMIKFSKLSSYIRQLDKENQELKEKLDKYENPEDMTLFAMWCTEKVKDENLELKKQLEEKENIACDWKDSCLENAGKIEILETQQKAFIKFLENELLDARYYARDIAHFIEYVLQKYKKLIGVSDETN